MMNSIVKSLALACLLGESQASDNQSLKALFPSDSGVKVLSGEDYDNDIYTSTGRWAHFITFMDPAGTDNQKVAQELSKLAKHFSGDENKIEFSVFDVEAE
jgi:hypothetical protein